MLKFSLKPDPVDAVPAPSLDLTIAASCSVQVGNGDVTAFPIDVVMPVDVFAVSNSPLHAPGTITFTFQTQSANFGFFGPVSGGPGIPAFRAIVASDLPSGTINTLAATQIGFGSGSNLLTGSANLVYDSTNSRVGIGSTITPTATLHILKNALNVTTQVDSNSITLENQTTAVSIVDALVSPSIIYSVSSKPFAGSAKNIKFRVDAQGFGSGAGLYKISGSNDSGTTYLELFRLGNTGIIQDNLNLFNHQIGNAGTGTSSIRFGTNALNFLNNAGVTGGYNIAIGVEAMLLNTSGAQNVALGYQALRANVSNSDNIAIGVGALVAATANFNTAVGSFALNAATTGNSNTAIGKNALLVNTTAIKNTAVGAGSLENTSTGGFNTGLGEDVLLHNTTGTDNIGIGWLAGSLNTTGVANINIGNSTGRSVTVGASNIFIGHESGFNASQLTTPTNSIAIGASTFTTASNQMVLGNASLTQVILRGVVSGVGTKALRYDDSTGIVTYAADSSLIPTFQQTLTAGSILSAAGNTVDGNGGAIVWTNFDEFDITADGNSHFDGGTYNFDTIINLNGQVNITTLVTNVGGGATASELRFLEPSGSGVNYTAFKAVVQGADIVYSLPAIVGVAGAVLTDVAGNGVLSWTSIASGITIGATIITSGTTTRVLYDNAGVVGEYTITGTGTVVAMQTSPSITTSLLTGSTTFALLNTTATTINAFGAATNTNLFASVSGGLLNLKNTGSAAGLALYEPSVDGTNATIFKATTQASTITYTLPNAAAGVDNSILTSSTGGVWSWQDPNALISAYAWPLAGTGDFTAPVLIRQLGSALQIDNDGNTLVEYGDIDNDNGGSLVSFNIDGSLTLNSRNTVLTMGGNGVTISVSPSTDQIYFSTSAAGLDANVSITSIGDWAGNANGTKISIDDNAVTVLVSTLAGVGTRMVTADTSGVLGTATIPTGTVTSVTGTSNRITSSGGTTPAIDIAASYVGQSSLTTLGTVTSGGLGTGATLGSVTVNIASSAVGDIWYAGASNVMTRLADVAVGSYLRSGGTTTAPLWSTLILPNAATANRIVYATSTNTYGESANLTFDGSLLVQTTAVSTGATTSSGRVLSANSLTSGTANYIASSSLTSGNLLQLVTNSTTLAANNELLDLNMSGANGTVAITATGIRVSVTNTNGTSGTNIGLDVTASGALTDNWAISATGNIKITTANTTQVTTSASLNISANALTTGTSAYLASSTLTSGKMIDIAVTGTAGLTNQVGINVSMSGANGTGAQTTYAGIFSNTHTGTSANVGVEFIVSGGSTNTAIRVASGNGRVALGQLTANATLDVVGGTISDSFATHSSGGSANFATATGLAITSNTTATLLYLGAAGVDFRVSLNGTTASSITASRPYSTFLVAASAVTEASTGTHALIASVVVLPPTITGAAGSVTNTATVYISAAPSASGAVNYALWIDDGTARLDGGILGTATNDNATAGNVGEVVSSLIATGSAVSLTTATGANVTSISLTAGDWDVSGNINYNLAAATVTGIVGGISSTTATVPTDGTEVDLGTLFVTATAVDGLTLPRKRFSLASTTTVFLITKATFSVGTIAAFGSITARRMR